MRLIDFIDGDLISPDKLAARLRTSKREIGETISISPESLSRKERVSSRATQTSPWRLIEILNSVTPLGNMIMAYARFQSEPIIGFGGRNPDRIIKDGEFDALRAPIQRRLEGGYG